ncbi:hypothetical protein AGLY_003642, partial [Aphis glycines]
MADSSRVESAVMIILCLLNKSIVKLDSKTVLLFLLKVHFFLQSNEHTWMDLSQFDSYICFFKRLIINSFLLLLFVPITICSFALSNSTSICLITFSQTSRQTSIHAFKRSSLTARFDLNCIASFSINSCLFNLLSRVATLFSKTSYNFLKHFHSGILLKRVLFLSWREAISARALTNSCFIRRDSHDSCKSGLQERRRLFDNNKESFEEIMLQSTNVIASDCYPKY